MGGITTNTLRKEYKLDTYDVMQHCKYSHATLPSLYRGGFAEYTFVLKHHLLRYIKRVYGADALEDVPAIVAAREAAERAQIKRAKLEEREAAAKRAADRVAEVRALSELPTSPPALARVLRMPKYVQESVLGDMTEQDDAAVLAKAQRLQELAEAFAAKRGEASKSYNAARWRFLAEFGIAEGRSADQLLWLFDLETELVEEWGVKDFVAVSSGPMLVNTRDQVRDKVLREKFVRECVDLEPVLSSAPEACRQSGTWRAGFMDAVANAVGAPYRGDKSYFRAQRSIAVPDAVRDLARRNVRPDRFASKAELDAEDAAQAKEAARRAEEAARQARMAELEAHRLAARQAEEAARQARKAELGAHRLASKCVCGGPAAVACAQRRCGVCCRNHPDVHCWRHKVFPHGSKPPGPKPPGPALKEPAASPSYAGPPSQPDSPAD